MTIGAKWGQLRTRLKQVFPEHQIYFRTNGNVRYFCLTTRAQLYAVGAIVAVGLGIGSAAVTVALRNSMINAQERILVTQNEQLQAMSSRVRQLATNMRAVRGDVNEMANRIERRHNFLEQLFSNKIEVNASTARTDGPVGRDETASVEAPLPASLDPSSLAQLAKIKQLEKEQLAFVATATAAAEARYRELSGNLRRLGINPQRLIGQSSGMGGPYIAASFDRGAFGYLEPGFKDLFVSWNRLTQLEKAIESIPTDRPVTSNAYASGFGVRYDPFTGMPAMHTGVDIPGGYGSAVIVTGDGVVTRASYWGAYGNLVEVDHGRGFVTRYGHLSAIKVRVGQKVEKGEQVGLMGSTGRSTGTHLHYEVRINGAAVNPRPYLESVFDVRQDQRSRNG